MLVQDYNNRKLKKQKMIQKRKKACAEFEEQIRKTWSRNPGEGRLQAAGLTSSCCCKKAGQLEMWSSFADFQAIVKVLILSSNTPSQTDGRNFHQFDLDAHHFYFYFLDWLGS
jgi:hypothetical protein